MDDVSQIGRTDESGNHELKQGAMAHIILNSGKLLLRMSACLSHNYRLCRFGKIDPDF